MVKSPVILLVIFFAGSCFGEVRIWTDKSGREIRAEYVSATKYKVKFRRVLDDRVFNVPITSLSRADQDYVTGKLKRGETDPYIVNSNSRLEELSKSQGPRPVSIGVGAVPDRTKIPSLGKEEIGERYPFIYSTFLNILIWWGETIAPEIMPHQRRDSSIERIAEDVERYFDHKSWFYGSLDRYAGKYSKRNLKGYVIVSHGRTHAPSLEELSKLTEGWYGVIACYQQYKPNASGRLRPVRSHYFTFVGVQGRSLLQNYMGVQYSFLMKDKLLAGSRLDENKRLRLANYKKEGYLEVTNPALVPGNLFGEDDVVVLESVLALELLKIPERED
ncbi:hypothetical protein DDZ13_12785 [Coraliomargarita sinensis]|uniref:SLA1 homology domain-containing protein n=1 Tax=Coraliomargarita sinensis TaxID=2174842 RepID=A0A317ZDC4_9BACT|nr:SHD1 domain-containing protein [Coraliomargarita sinensis]PXA03294.1 hypothetical protein DDZ13_12785 [Coraliomargarita sinensis]